MSDLAQNQAQPSVDAAPVIDNFPGAGVAPSNQSPANNRPAGVYDSASSFELAQRMAKSLAASDMVPAQFQGNLSNCMIALEVSHRVGTSPFQVMQNLYIVHGKPGWSSQYVIAAVNASGRFTPMEFVFFGEEGTDSWGCLAQAKTRDGTVVSGTKVTMAMAKAEGWVTKKGSKWQTMPELMLRYRAASFFGKLYAPDILLGMQTAEEVADYIDMETGEVHSAQSVRNSRKPAPLS